MSTILSPQGNNKTEQRSFFCELDQFFSFPNHEVRKTTTPNEAWWIWLHVTVTNVQTFLKEPRSHFISRLSMIVRVNVVLNKTVLDCSWRFDNLCGSHLQCQDEMQLANRNRLFTGCHFSSVHSIRTDRNMDYTGLYSVGVLDMTRVRVLHHVSWWLVKLSRDWYYWLSEDS